jgi:hypothetical protein
MISASTFKDGAAIFNSSHCGVATGFAISWRYLTRAEIDHAAGAGKGLSTAFGTWYVATPMVCNVLLCGPQHMQHLTGLKRPYSIISSTRANNAGGTVRPRASANLKMQSTYAAARR